MEQWYRARFDNIEKINIVKNTDKFVYLYNHCREAKNCDFQSYHTTWEEARLELIKRKQKLISKIKENLKYTEKELLKIKQLKK